MGLLFPAPKGSNFSDPTNFAPRFGVAYDASGTGSTVIRGGVGLFYDILKDEDSLQFSGQARFGYNDLLFNTPSGLTSTGSGIYQNPYAASAASIPFPRNRLPRTSTSVPLDFYP